MCSLTFFNVFLNWKEKQVSNIILEYYPLWRTRLSLDLWIFGLRTFNVSTNRFIVYIYRLVKFFYGVVLRKHLLKLDIAIIRYLPPLTASEVSTLLLVISVFRRFVSKHMCGRVRKMVENVQRNNCIVCNVNMPNDMCVGRACCVQ